MKKIILIIILIYSILGVNAYEHNYMYYNCIGEVERTGGKFAYFPVRYLDENNEPEDIVVWNHGHSVCSEDDFFNFWRFSLKKNPNFDLGDVGVICFYKYAGEQIMLFKGIDY